MTAEGDAGDVAGTMLPKYHLPHKHSDSQRREEVVGQLRKVPGRGESTGKWEMETDMEGQKPGGWQ